MQFSFHPFPITSLITDLGFYLVIESVSELADNQSSTGREKPYKLMLLR